MSYGKKLRKDIKLTKLLLLIFTLNSYAFITGKNESEILENAKKATLKVEVLDVKTGERSFGTAFFMGSDGHAITSSHNIWETLESNNKEKIITFSNSDGETFDKVKVVKCSNPNELDLCFLHFTDHKPKHYFVYDNSFKLGKGNTIQHIGHCKGDYSLKRGKLKDSVKVLKDYYPSLLGKHSAHVFDGDYGACGGDSGAALFYIDGISRKEAVLIGVITGGKTGEKWNGKDYENYYKYKYAIDIQEYKNLVKKDGVSRDISNIVSEKKKSKNDRLEEAKKNRDIKKYYEILYGTDK